MKTKQTAFSFLAGQLADHATNKLTDEHKRHLSYIQHRYRKGEVSREISVGNVWRIIVKELPMTLTKDQQIELATGLLDS
jgi:hypothetical protein